MSFGRICSRRLSGTGDEEGAAPAQRGEPLLLLLLSPCDAAGEDLRAVFSVLVVPGKVFKQAEPSLTPL
jgi:hypothetical protein